MAIPDPTRILQFEQHGDITRLAEELVKRLNENTRRIRIVEQRMDRMDNSINALEDNTLNQLNDLKMFLEKITDRLVSLSEKLVGIESEILRLSKELSKTATKREFKEIETYMELINPVTAKYVTKDEMERYISLKIPKAKKA
ncbi:MAG: hypothetical protein HYT70_00630 [Candidatus Aenigmarchaeota archaeon]|nr:hypothetical protein [Candidatus Aenigmarchaeota archaeon]